MTATQIFLGIDPGYDRLGWAVGSWNGKTWSSLDFGCIITDPAIELTQRYHQIIIDFQAILTEFSPKVVGLESLFFSKNQTTALKVSEVRGVILSLLLQSGKIDQIIDLKPNQIKQAVTGFGHADKLAVAKMVRLELQLGEQPIIDDAMDALAMLLTVKTLYVSPHHRSTPTLK